MVPILASLAAQGLSILAGAVMAKGKDVIEEKLGVNIEESLTSEEGLYKLKQLEVEHQEFLIDSAMQETKMYIEDTKSARQLGIELSKSDSWLNQNIMPFLALVTIFGGAWILLDSSNSEVRMAAVSMMTMVLGYFFGSSKGSKDKQELLSQLKTGN